MIFIKVPYDARPGEIIGLNSNNTFTTCDQCGREMPMADAFLPVKETPSYYKRQHICVKCYAQAQYEKDAERNMELLHRIFNPGLPSDNEQEDEEDEQ